MDRALTYRASVLREWQGTDSYAVVRAMLDELYQERLAKLLRDGKEQYDENLGWLHGLTEALRLAEQTITDESRQRPQEITRG